jgi:hypothetical protein
MPYVYCMATATTTQEIEMTTTKTTTLNKVGNAYATADLKYRVYKSAGWWRLYCADNLGAPSDNALSTIKAEALADAEQIILIAEFATGPTSITTEADLPWDRTERRPSAVFSAKYQDSDAENPCVCCGRKTGKNPLGAIIVGGGAFMCRPEDANAFEKYDGGWMGWFPVGSECAKKFPAGYLTTLTGE